MKKTYTIKIMNESFNKIISKKLGNISDIWQKNEDLSIIETISSLEQYFQKLAINNSIIKSQLNEEFKRYQASLYHFMLYYLPKPNHSFIINIKKSLFFAAFIGNNYKSLQISCPIYFSEESMLDDLNKLLNIKELKFILKEIDINSILLRDVNSKIVNILRKINKKHCFNLNQLKEIPYANYDLKKTLQMKGSQFSNLRWHLNKFNSKNYKIELVQHTHIEKKINHLIGKWRRHAIREREFSFSDVRSDKFGAKLVSAMINMNNNDSHDDFVFLNPDKCFFRVLKINNIVSSFHMGFPLGFFKKSTIFAHSIGISDLSIPHLAEYAQIDFWKYIYHYGFRYVNDGPSWKRSLEIYKNKFRPTHIQKYYWATLSLKK